MYEKGSNQKMGKQCQFLTSPKNSVLSIWQSLSLVYEYISNQEVKNEVLHFHKNFLLSDLTKIPTSMSNP